MSFSDDESISDRPSKSQRKRDMEALQKLGETLVKLPASQLDTIPLTGRLLEAIQEARTLTSHGAIRRQLQFIGRLMRDVDAAPIEEALAQIKLKSQQSTQKFHQIERWRDQLLKDSKYIQEFYQQFPKTDVTHLEKLVKDAHRDVKGADKELFRFLREVVSKDKR